MWPTSSRFNAALIQSHHRAQRVEVLEGGEVRTILDVLVDGDVTVSRSMAIRRNCSVRLVDETGTLTPRSAADLLAPRGTELRLYRGITFEDGTSEVVPLITARISKPTVTYRDGGLVIDIRGYDRAKAIERARFWEPYIIPVGTNVRSAIEDMATSRMAAVQTNLAITTRQTPLLVYAKGDDPWKALSELADSAGQEIFFDQMGVLTTREVVDPEFQTPVWSYTLGEEAILLDAEKELDEERTYNGVIVDGENSTLTVRAEAWDTNPASPTYYDPDSPEDSVYGPVPYFYSSPLFTAQAQAQATADARLTLVKGMLERVSFTSVVNPAHDVGDVVSVQAPPLATGGHYSLEDLRIPLRSGALQAKGKRVQRT